MDLLGWWEFGRCVGLWELGCLVWQFFWRIRLGEVMWYVSTNQNCGGWWLGRVERPIGVKCRRFCLGLIGCVKTSVFLSAVGWCVFRGALGRWEVGWFVI